MNGSNFAEVTKSVSTHFCAQTSVTVGVQFTRDWYRESVMFLGGIRLISLPSALFLRNRGAGMNESGSSTQKLSVRGEEGPWSRMCSGSLEKKGTIIRG